jgi:hypothetical protein
MADTKYPGPPEAQAILAAQEQDWSEVTTVLSAMLPDEIQRLGTGAEGLAAACTEALRLGFHATPETL